MRYNYWEIVDHRYDREYLELRFIKEFIDSDHWKYSVSFIGIENADQLDGTIPNGTSIWSEDSGFLCDFIEQILSEAYIPESVKGNENNPLSYNEIQQDRESKDEDKRIETLSCSFTSTPNNFSNDRLNEELIATVDEGTKTIALMNQFEGYGSFNNIPYKRLIIKNIKYSWALGLPRSSGINLVIERCTTDNYIGDITFTEFKQQRDQDFRAFLKKEITPDIADKYLDTNRIYRFSKPYKLRAQNKRNREGYGWEWDWSGGYGDYTEGTFYGETTNYVFVGAYITSWTAAFYDPAKRKPFTGDLQEVKNLSEKSFRENNQVNNVSETDMTPDNTKSNDDNFGDFENIQQPISNLKTENVSLSYVIHSYEGSYLDITNERLTRYNLLVRQEGITKIYIPVFVDSASCIIYMHTNLYNAHKNILNKKSVILRDLQYHLDKEFPLKKLIPERQRDEEVYSDTVFRSIEEQPILQNKINSPSPNVNTKYEYSFVTDDELFKDKDCLNYYVKVTTTERNCVYVPVVISHDLHLILILKNTLIKYKTSLQKPELTFLSSMNELSPSINRITFRVDTRGIFENNSFSENTMNSALETRENNIVTNKTPTKIIRINYGDSCPKCKKTAPIKIITVIARNGLEKTISARSCCCGTIYLTKKQYSNLIDRHLYDIALEDTKPFVPVIDRLAMYSKSITSKHKSSSYSSTKSSTHNTQNSNNSRIKICPVCRDKVSSLFSNTGMCWNCYKEQMSSRFD